MAKVVKTFRGNVHKFSDFPVEFKWAQHTWKKDQGHTKEPNLSLKSTSTQRWGLLEALKTCALDITRSTQVRESTTM